MKASIVQRWGASPIFTEVADLCPPRDDEVLIDVQAVGLHSLVRARTQGKHYSSGSLPHLLGTDGVGAANGKLVYFSALKSKGSFAEKVIIPSSDVFEILEGVNHIQPVAFVNPAFSSLMAIQKRTTDLPDKFSVLIIGVTTISGQIANDIARHLKEEKAFVCARDRETMQVLKVDEKIVLQQSPDKTDFSAFSEVDLVLDYISGQVAAEFFGTIKPSRLVQFIHIGRMSSPTFTITGRKLRKHDITVRGSGIGSWTSDELGEELL